MVPATLHFVLSPIVLASESPQRSSLLTGLGWKFSVVPSGLDEGAIPERDPLLRSRLLARLKAREVARKHPNAIVIGCDTLVAAEDGTLLEKPTDESDARRMIMLLSGRTCIVHSGLCVCMGGREEHDVSSTAVRFSPLTPAGVDSWIATGLWRGRSGAFQIDGPGQLMIERIEGDWTGVVGLPVFLLGRLFMRLCLPLPSAESSSSELR